MNQLFILFTAAMFAVSAPAESATAKKSTKPVATKKATTVKKKPPVSNVRPEVKKPKKVERKATVTKKKTKR
jgi:hypothetical protein